VYRTAIVALMAQCRNSFVRMRLFRLQRRLPFPTNKGTAPHAHAMRIAPRPVRIAAPNMT